MQRNDFLKGYFARGKMLKSATYYKFQLLMLINGMIGSQSLIASQHEGV